MNKIVIYFLLILSGSTFAQKYVPFPTENAQWNVFYASSWNQPMDTTLMKYSLQGDTIINNIQYKKVCRNIGTTTNPVFKGVGGLREQNKKIYYNGFGYNENYGGFNNIENLLYDFNKKVGDTVKVNQWREYTITKIDSVKIGNEYRKRYNDCIIEGIGDVVSGLFGIMVLIPTCDCYQEWHFICFSQNGESVYKNPDYVDCGSTKKWSEKKYLADAACWTEFTININTNWVVYKSQYYLDGDTILSGKTYKKVIGKSPNNLEQPTYYIGAIREEGGKIFKQYTDYETMVAGEFLLYDFNVKVGDTIHSTSPSGELSRKPVVTKIDTIDLMTGEKRKRFFFDQSSEKIWIEGIGSVGGLFNEAYEHLTNYTTTHLVCYKQGGIEYYKNSSLCSDGTCCDVLTGLETPKLLNPSISLSPNPVTGSSIIKWEVSDNNLFSTLVVTDVLGKTIKVLNVSGKNEMTIQRNDFTPGLYFCRLHASNGEENVIKMIIQ